MVSASGLEVYVAEVFAISVHELNGTIELCHLTTDPVWPERERSPLGLPEQMVVPPVRVPPTEIGSTVTVVSEEFAAEQTPFWTTALNLFVCVRISEVYVAEVFAISVQELNGTMELCHLTTDPV